jgi:hypothetical protein
MAFETADSDDDSGISSSNLPKFSGQANEDIDDFIDELESLYFYREGSQDALVRVLPLVLTGGALTWLLRLNKNNARPSLQSWDDWKDALRKAFYPRNHVQTMRRRCWYRQLEADESFSSYYWDKRNLQRFVFRDITPDSDLIFDILQGMPLQMQGQLSNFGRPGYTLEEFYRHVIDLESHLRPAGPDMNASQRKTGRGNGSSRR